MKIARRETKSAAVAKPAAPKQRTKSRMIGALEIKATDDGKRTFEGILSSSHIDLGNWAYRDIVWPGAFKRTLQNFRNAKNAYIPLLNSHDAYDVFSALGQMLDGEERLTGKTLRYEQENGDDLEVPEMYLHTEWQVIDGPDGDRLLDRLRSGAVRKMSMGYEVYREEFVKLKQYGDTRLIRECALAEGSLVVFPMNPNADVDLSSVKHLLDAIRDGTLTDDDKAALSGLSADMKAQLRALLADEPPADASIENDAEPPADAAPPGLAPDDPKRLDFEARFRDLTLRSLGIAA